VGATGANTPQRPNGWVQRVLGRRAGLRVAFALAAAGTKGALQGSGGGLAVEGAYLQTPYHGAMKPEVRAALLEHIGTRQRVLSGLTRVQRMTLIEVLIYDFFAEQRRVLVKWAALTGQSAQIDTGYISQHLASIVLTTPGQGFKGKGVDLVDGSEVKSAAILGGVDRPRWNHNMGTVASDGKRAAAGQRPMYESYLVDAPVMFYVLFDRVVDEASDDDSLPVLRVRAWAVDAKNDDDWRAIFEEYVAGRTPGRYNLQLHPPVGYDDDIVVNTLDNLDFAETKVLEIRFTVPEGPTSPLEIDWIVEPPESVLPIKGRTQRLPWKRGGRPSRLEGVAGHALELAELEVLFPEVPELAGTIPVVDSASPDAPTDGDED